MRQKKNLCWILLLGFLIGIHQGQIALWEGEDPEPKLVLPYSVSNLPPADQAALRKGIRIHSLEDVIRFMEDYCS